MKRVVEKVKDIVEVCPFTNLHDFAADPALTLGSYHFTDITADLMAKWLDRVTGIRRGQGAALSLAGFRGVGKSHFLAVVGAIISRPELRARIGDQHVATSADRLSRRRGAVATVRRGSGTSLLDEIKRGVGEMLDVSPSTLSESLYNILLTAMEHAGDVPLVFLVDTALGREARVARDDGAILSELAEACKALGAFVGVALDDDISGADGPNSSISSSFSIDYLDQEHLYKIVDSHIFAKHSSKLPLLHEIYEDYRESLPAFRWSEPRFTSLYPLHPATLEIAPLIRLYIHDFALLGFAAEAGVKILGRPANSLIGLDEIFDGVESKLRAAEELNDAFVAYDTLERDVVSKIPVQFRLPGKLLLKGLFMLSLDGQGSTAAEVSASMMIVDDKGSAGDVGNLLDSFAAALPNSIERIVRDTGDPKYCFRLTAKNDVDDVLAAAILNVPDDVIWSILLRQTGEKYSDAELLSESGASRTTCTIEWRGSLRRGEIVWNAADPVREQLDWSVNVVRGLLPPQVEDGNARPSIVWHLGTLTADESETIRRYHVLHTDTAIREQFGDGLGTAVHVHTITVEKIWQRIFLQDAKIVCGGREFEFTDGARSAYGFSNLFTTMLGPIFETYYPSHPEFAQPLGAQQCSTLISGFFTGSVTSNADVQKLAEDIALPLGLAVKHGDLYVAAHAEILTELPVVKNALAGLQLDSTTVFPLAAISAAMHAPPVGLSREAQRLIFAALVAQRQFEFVTSSGNRINHRSLDLQILWDDIVGIARPLNELYSPERLLLWAKLITANSGLQSLDRSEDRLLVLDSLTGWLAGWREGRILVEFDALPDEYLNAAIWRTAASLRKSFGSVAEAIEALDENTASLDKCIHTIAELFSDSEAEFEKKKNDLRVLRDYTLAARRRDQIAKYVSLSESTRDREVEAARTELLVALTVIDPNETNLANGRVEPLWLTFKDVYVTHYAAQHNAVIDSVSGGDVLKEILRSESWSAFESFSIVPSFDQRYIERARTLIREIRQLYCDAKVEEELKNSPYCTCSFRLAEYDRLIDIAGELRRVVSGGLTYFRNQLLENADLMIRATDTDAMAASVREILAKVANEKEFLQLPSQSIRILKLTAFQMSDEQGEEMLASEPSYREIAEESEDFEQWEHELKGSEVFVNTEL